MIPFTRILGYGNTVTPIDKTIKKISGGGYHYVYLTNGGYLYGIGYNNNNQLRNCPNRYQYNEFWLIDTEVTDVWCGDRCTLYYKASTSEWIYNGEYDAIGYTTTPNILSPITGTDVSNLMPEYSTIKEMDIGRYAIAYINQSNELYSRGQNTNGTCGTGNTLRVANFTRMGKDYHKNLWCGEYATIAVGVAPTSVYLYGCGLPSYGQFGAGNNTAKNTWGLILSGGTSEYMGSSSSTIALWTPTTFVGAGWQLRGQLGDGVSTNTEQTSWKTTINMPKPIQVGSRGFGTSSPRNIYMSTDGTFYASGMANYSGLLNDTSVFTVIPTFTTPEDKSKVKICCGDIYSIIFDGKKIWGCGNGSVMPGKVVGDEKIFTEITLK